MNLRLRGAMAVFAATALALTFGPAVAQAAGQVTAGAVADTFVTEASPTADWSAAGSARISNDPEKTAYFRFNVSGVPTGAPIISATLKLTGTGSQVSQTVNVHRVASNTWPETMNYNTRVPVGAQLSSGAVAANKATSFNVTGAVSGNGLVSFAVARTTGSGDNLVGTSENGTAANRPVLTVAYGDAAPVNQGPVVSAGADQAVTLPASASLDGTVTDDGQPSGTVTQTWSKVSGPGTVTFGSPNAQDTTAAFGSAGTYVLRLTASDGALSSSDDVTVVATAAQTNTAPAVNAGPDQSITLPSGASLDGTVTDDGLPSGTVTQSWSKVSGPGTVTFGSPNAQDTTANFSAAGSYVLRLTATDGALSSSDDVSVSVAAQPVTPPSSSLPYGPDSFFQSTVTNAPIDAALTASFQSFMAQHEEQGGNGVFWPKVNLNPGWSGHNYVHREGGTAPIWKLVGTNTGISNTRLGILKTQGVHMADNVWDTVPTGDQDRLLVVEDFVLGYTMQCADVVPNQATRTFTASNCGIMWHSSNGLDYRNPQSDDQRNFSSRGRILDAMQVPRAELEAAQAAGTGLGHVMHLFFVGTCGDDGYVHPMVGAENKPCWTGPVAGSENDGGWGAEGTRIRIKPSVDLVARGLTGEALVIARTLQENGTYIGDNAGGATQLKIGPPEDYVGTNLTPDVFKGKLDWRTDFEVVQPGWQN